MSDKKSEIETIIRFCISFMEKNNINELIDESPRKSSSFWYKLCLSYYGEYHFNKAMRLKNLWTTNSNDFKNKVSQYFKSKNPEVIFHF